jgi:cobalt-precorrin 5A hydrolase
LDKKIIIISLTKQGLKTASRIAERLDGAVCYGPADRAEGNCRSLPGSLKDSMDFLWADAQCLIFIAAAGMVVRLIAPYLSDKETDPAVIVVDHRGRFAVSLLSGHVGGGNDLAYEVAQILDGQAVITTATDNLDYPGWDILARDYGLEVINKELLAELTGVWLDGTELALVDYIGFLPIDIPGVVHWPNIDTLPQERYGVYVGFREVTTHDKVLFLKPDKLSIGIGCHCSITADELEQALRNLLSTNDLDLSRVVRIASVSRRKDTPALFKLSEKLDIPLKFFEPEILAAIKTPNPSAIAEQMVATPSVCEAASLANWAYAHIIVEKTKWPNLTLAAAVAR